MPFIRLKKFRFICWFFFCYCYEKVMDFVNIFCAFIEMTVFFYLYSMTVHNIVLIYYCMLNQPCVHTWSTILFMIQFASLLLRIFVFIFLGSLGCSFFFLGMSLSILYMLFNFHIFLDFLLLLIFKFIPLWSENICCMILIPPNRLRLIL